jgi:hypothetical protein
VAGDNCIVKVKQSHYTPRRRLGQKRYSSYSFSISLLDGGEWSASRPVRGLGQDEVPPVPVVQEAGWAPQPVWTQRLEKNSSCLCRGSDLDRPVVQSVVIYYTDWATRANNLHGKTTRNFVSLATAYVSQQSTLLHCSLTRKVTSSLLVSEMRRAYVFITPCIIIET